MVQPNAAEFRRVLGHFPTGVTVVTGLDPASNPVGLTIGSFTSVSLDPALVAFLPTRGSTRWQAISASGRFCVNILGAHQEEICRTFAGRAEVDFDQFPWTPAGSGSPRLDGVIAWIDCDVEAVHEAGDHLIVVGRVKEMMLAEPSLPLVFFQGGYGRFHSLTLAAWEGDLRAQLESADAARPAMAALSDDLGLECIASAVVGEDMIVVANAGTAKARRLPTHVGQRIPFLPPLGTTFAAWALPDQREAWLQRAELGHRAALLRTLDEVRSAGYALGQGAAWREGVTSALEDYEGPGLRADPASSIATLVRDLDPSYESPMQERERGSAVHAITVPVLDADGHAVLALSLIVLAGSPGARTFDHHLDRLTFAASEIAKAVRASAGDHVATGVRR